MKLGTKLVAGKEKVIDPQTMSLVPPIYPSAVYTFENAQHGADLFAGERDGYVYTRLDNPTLRVLEEKIAYLEGGEKGAAFASGMSAISTTILALCEAGDNIIASSPIYGGTFALLDKLVPKWGIEVRWAKANNFATEVEEKGLIDDKTRLFLTESPANPSLDLVDFKATSELAHKHNIPAAVDTTFATVYAQKPLEFGMDIVIYSATKYVGGHSDAVGGLVVTSEKLHERIKCETSVDLGGVLGPFNAFLFLRGLQTLGVRMDRHQENALKIAKYLENKSQVERVYYPWLESHPQYELAKRQMTNGSGMVTFILSGGREKGKNFLDALELCNVAVSLGAVNTLIEHPASMTHSTYDEDQLAAAGIAEGLIRMSVGIEDVDDIIDDLEKGFQAI